MAVFYNSETGQYDQESQSLNPVEEAAFLANEARLHTGTGWHEYSSIAQMNAAITANHWPAPTQNNDPATAAAAQAAGVATQAAKKTGILTGLNAIGDFFSRLTQANTWLRVVEAVLGAGLILVGLAHLAGDTAVGRNATKIATRAALL